MILTGFLLTLGLWYSTSTVKFLDCSCAMFSPKSASEVMNNQVPGCTWPPSLNQTHEPICSLQVKPWSVHNRLKQLSDKCALIHAAHECGICMASRADNKVSICVPATLIINECSRTAYCNCRLLHHYQGLQKWLAYADTMHHLIVMRPRHILLSILSALWVLSA